MNPNIYKNQKERGLKRKYEYIMSRGGKCSQCGYNKNLAALEFHHLNPSEKLHQVDVRVFANSSLKKIEAELNKCRLLCSNCHREEHNPELEFGNIPVLIANVNRTSFSTIVGKKCLVCDNRFKACSGKKYCSEECRYKHHPSKQEVLELYTTLKSWNKVAIKLGTTRKIIQRIRKDS